MVVLEAAEEVDLESAVPLDGIVPLGVEIAPVDPIEMTTAVEVVEVARVP